jgi:hypothetical protein
VPELLQWFGLFGGGIAWAVHLGLGFFVAQARCGAGSVHWGVDNTTWQVVLMIAAAAVVALAEAACILTILGTSDSTYEDVPPYGRRRFFALGAAAGNVLFLVAILLEGIGSIAHDPCRQL